MTPISPAGGAGSAVVTPLRAPGLRATIERTARRVDEALCAALRRERRRFRVHPSVDAETLRDLGLSHTALLASPVDPVERQPSHRCRA